MTAATLRRARQVATTSLARAATTARVLTGAGVVRPYGPVTLARLGHTLARWGTGPAGGFTSLAVRCPDRVGVIDERGELTFGELDRRSNALARALRDRGVGEGDAVALMCRNHRGFIDASIAVAKLGADLLYLNTAFAGPQLAEVLDREDPAVVVHDEEFAELLAGAEVRDHVLAWTDDADGAGADTLEGLIAGASGAPVDPPRRHTRIVILTSGTTGTPKGAPRNEAGFDAAVSLLSRMPLREGWRTHIAAPLFHTWGFAHFALSMLLGSTLVLRRRFDPEDCLRTLSEHRCDSAVVIPVMMQRILRLPAETLDAHPLPHLKATVASGSALAGDLALEWMDRFGDNLYNVYGSTEVAWASIATPEDLRAAPDSAGRPPWATTVRILGDDDRELPRGETGRIFVGNGLLFEGYTGGGSKDMVDGLMASGDVGHLGDDGRLYIEGRDDDMIVSGGENVFPQEVEDCLARHEAVREAACLGVDDEDFGQRLRAFVVPADSAKASEDDLAAWVKQNLARYKVPRDFRFLDELPRNATGKVLKTELAERD